MWRATDENNYYVTRWNPLESNLRTYKVENGKRSQLQSISFDASEKSWHHLQVDVRGPVHTVTFDGSRSRMMLEDASFQDGGKVGLWTKADAETEFTDFSVRVR